MSSSKLEQQYRQRVPTLEKVARELECLLCEVLSGFEHLDTVRSRVKTVESFIEKATRQEKKYLNPLEEILDQIGCRVVVYFKSDLEEVQGLVREEFHRIEVDRKRPEKPSIFEYEAIHYTCHIPQHIADKYSCPIHFFELQIKTLFQHACAQAYHGMGYKGPYAIDFHDDRLMHFAFASAWGADEIFDQIWTKLNASLKPTQN